VPLRQKVGVACLWRKGLSVDAYLSRARYDVFDATNGGVGAVDEIVAVGIGGSAHVKAKIQPLGERIVDMLHLKDLFL